MAPRFMPTGRHCRMCGTPLTYRTIDHTLAIGGEFVKYTNVRHYTCPQGCPTSDYDLSKADPVGSPTKPTVPFWFANGGGTPTSSKKKKAASEDGAEAKPKPERRPKRDAEPAGEAAASEAASAKESAGEGTGDETAATADPGDESAESAPPVDEPKTAAGDVAAAKEAPARPARPAKKAATDEAAEAPAIELKNVKQPPPPPDPAHVKRMEMLSRLGRIYVGIGLVLAYVIFAVGIILSHGSPAIKVVAAFLLTVGALYTAILLVGGMEGEEELQAKE